jgi:hypothetical protein
VDVVAESPTARQCLAELEDWCAIASTEDQEFNCTESTIRKRTDAQARSHCVVSSRLTLSGSAAVLLFPFVLAQGVFDVSELAAFDSVRPG